MKRLTIAAAVVVALVGACTDGSTPTGPTSVAGQTTTAAAPSPTTTQTTVTPPPPVPVNEEARDGAFAFTVKFVSTADTVPGPGDNLENVIHPQGIFVWIICGSEE